jgi:phosphatidate phosphatase PAH1
MKDNLKDILSNLNPDIDQETLLLYLQGKLSAEKQHELEMQMLDNEFEAEAMEGLQSMSNKQNVSYLVEQLNRDLHKKTAQKKSRREKLRLKSDPWIWISILILLLLIVVSYLIIHQYLKG